ncbi:serpin family protein [Fischerella thermalis]|uniref:Proteinase inhibitor I4 serpin n=2 Tax=Fischerella TaxID=1190 RepID=G6FWX7_9CYAN|nr:serpin family protein [Fischerella thermalis]EHC11142.1 proteinase inhibitor I4 serpin [Fischerella thermalis JSC-11]PLZ12661.1 proteinase inhibitor I4 serpin [Fischerella thermalis WC114]PLZ13655.1 proteinase inhibitor I4 serpin [Fischerella thermalis WC119]PLZ22361.1 proteinase inhibitor I4 serpin [Fischerella thermalis WC157]PLZ24542.1 proteinase inhibitor I4 serpin [Fischerella thermalis WC341]
MKQKFGSSWEKFLQRRYAVRLGRRYALAAASVVLMGVIGCTQVEGNTKVYAQSSVPRSESLAQKSVLPDTKLILANTKFGFKLFEEVLKQENNKNVFISPASVAIALDMTYNGANGSTQRAMAKALELQGLSLQEINSSNAALKQLLENSDPEIQLNIANSLWANQEVKFNADFIKKNQDFYQAKVTNLNFQDPNSVSKINNWVSESTRGRINKIIERIEPDQVLFLLNAIYFKGKWTNEFDKQQTVQQPFYLTSGTQKQHPMMSQKGKYKYYENEQFQAASLPYGKDGKFSFYVFLPKKNSNLKSFYENLNAENWEKWISQFSLREGLIRLPRFKMDYEITLNTALEALGIGEAFTNQADFSQMGQNFQISEVKHKTFVEVNEEGTEAAATTSVGVTAVSATVNQQPFQMIVDRPFFCAIRDNQTGSILFMGAILDP